MATSIWSVINQETGVRSRHRIRNLNAVIQRWEVILLLAGSAVLQILFASYLRFALYLDLPLILVLYIGWYSKPARGGATGMAFGLVEDAVYRSFIGLNGLSKTLIGFAASWSSRVFRLEDVVSRCTFMTAASLLDSAIVYLMLLVLEQPVSERFWINASIKAGVTGAIGALGSRFYDHFKFPKKDFRRMAS